MGIFSLDSKEILKAFAEETHQERVLARIYTQFHSAAGLAEGAEQPILEISQEADWAITRAFKEFDGKHHPELIPGGAWLQYGPPVNFDLANWAITVR